MGPANDGPVPFVPELSEMIVRVPVARNEIHDQCPVVGCVVGETDRGVEQRRDGAAVGEDRESARRQVGQHERIQVQVGREYPLVDGVVDQLRRPREAGLVEHQLAAPPGRTVREFHRDVERGGALADRDLHAPAGGVADVKGGEVRVDVDERDIAGADGATVRVEHAAAHRGRGFRPREIRVWRREPYRYRRISSLGCRASITATATAAATAACRKRQGKQ